MGHDVSWHFSGPDRVWLGQLLSRAPHFKRFNDPYYEYYSSTKPHRHPDAIASVTNAGLDFTDFGDPAILSDVLEFLRPHISASWGKIGEKY